MLNNIQGLRAIAALMVVHGHASAALGLRFHGGANGVDLFFVISGFIIAYVANTDSSQFFTRRLIRIVPTYWMSTLAVFALVVALPSLFRNTSSDVGLLIRSLLFLPDASNVHSDGLPHPTLGGGWTLNYEMYFYVVFALALAISKQRATLVATAILAAVMAIVHVTSLRQHAVSYFYGYPIVTEFIFGMVAFHYVRYAEAHAPVGRQIDGQKWMLLISAVGGLVLLWFIEELFGSTDRWLSSGIPAFVVVGSAVMLERIHGWRVVDKLTILIGDASYVLYLSQAYVVLGITRLVLGGRRFSEPVGQIVVLGLMAVSVVVAVVLHRYGEKPLLAYIKRRMLRPRVKGVGAASAVSTTAAVPRA